MKLRNILYCLLFLSSATGLVSCSHDNPPFNELGGTRWTATNIAAGVLIDVCFGPVGTDDISTTFYCDPVPYDTRGQKIDTVGNRQYDMKGNYTPKKSTTDKGETVTGYEWAVNLISADGSSHYGELVYDNRRMCFRILERAFPMSQNE